MKFQVTCNVCRKDIVILTKKFQFLPFGIVYSLRYTPKDNEIQALMLHDMSGMTKNYSHAHSQYISKKTLNNVTVNMPKILRQYSFGMTLNYLAPIGKLHYMKEIYLLTSVKMSLT